MNIFFRTATSIDYFFGQTVRPSDMTISSRSVYYPSFAHFSKIQNAPLPCRRELRCLAQNLVINSPLETVTTLIVECKFYVYNLVIVGGSFKMRIISISQPFFHS